MNIEKHLILVKNEDKTEQIKSCEYANGKWEVVYSNNNTVYSYSFINVVWHKNPREIIADFSIVYENDQPMSGVARIFDFGEYVRIVFKTGYKKVYPHSSIIIEETCLKNKDANNCFEYVKKLADHVGTKIEEDISFLSKQYSRLANISPRSVLSAYLEGKPLKEENRPTEPIFPFGFNLSQKSATEKALVE